MLKTVTNSINASQIQTPITLPGDVTLSTGNLVIGTAGKGIDFAANGGEVLSQYEKGNWTPVVTAGVGSITSYTINAATYVQIGSQVTAYFDFTITNNGTGAGLINVSLPITTPVVSAFGAARETAVTGASILVALYSGSTIFLETMVASAYPGGTNYRIRGSITYAI
jgi:hypothetical protein